MSILWPERERPSPLDLSIDAQRLQINGPFLRPAVRHSPRRNLYAPDPMLLSWTERLEAWLWSKRRAHALFGWALRLFPGPDTADDLGTILRFMAMIAAAAIALAAGFVIGGK